VPCGASKDLPLFEIARVLVRVDQVARFIVNPNHWTVSFITGWISHAA
jgi:hypothetical protein